MLLITLDQLKEKYQENYQRVLSLSFKEPLVIVPLQGVLKKKMKDRKSPRKPLDTLA